MNDKREARSLDDLPEIAEWIMNSVKGNIILLKGEMGAGKTTLIREICKYLGVVDEVNSPTYSLVNEYYSPAHGSIYHFDLYRLNSEEEAMDMGIEEYLYSGNLCLIEWPEKIRNLLPSNCVELIINVSGSLRTFEINTTEHE